MADLRRERAEVEAFLNDREAQRTRRRQPHYLPREYYRSPEAIFCVTLCARHHGSPFASAAMAVPTIDALIHYRTRGLWMVSAYCLLPDHLHAVVRLRIPGRPATVLWAGEGEAPRDLVRLVGEFKSYTTS